MTLLDAYQIFNLRYLRVVLLDPYLYAFGTRLGPASLPPAASKDRIDWAIIAVHRGWLRVECESRAATDVHTATRAMCRKFDGDLSKGLWHVKPLVLRRAASYSRRRCATPTSWTTATPVKLLYLEVDQERR